MQVTAWVVGNESVPPNTSVTTFELIDNRYAREAIRGAATDYWSNESGYDAVNIPPKDEDATPDGPNPQYVSYRNATLRVTYITLG